MIDIPIVLNIFHYFSFLLFFRKINIPPSKLNLLEIRRFGAK